MIKQALISVSDKTGIVEFAQSLIQFGVTIMSTGGTAKWLAEAGLAVIEVADYTGFPEILDGRVKTLHPKIHGGLLAQRDNDAQMRVLAAHGITTIDLLVVNLYPFRQVIAKNACTFDEAIEHIDIGGPALLRSAAKNHRDVTVIVDPVDYAAVLDEMRSNDHTVSDATKFRLAAKVFALTAQYDSAISHYLTNCDRDQSAAMDSAYPATLTLTFNKVQDLRYGENPHQKAAFYRDSEPGAPANTFASYQQLQGKPLSYNNLVDADAAWECVKSFESFGKSACVIVKHANPCGAALGMDCRDAYLKALQTDPSSAFGGIIAVNRELDETAAQAIAQQFVEVLVAPAFSEGARAVFAAKQNVRLLEVPVNPTNLPCDAPSPFDLKRISGGLLVQSPDAKDASMHELRVATKRHPAPKEMDDLRLASCVAKFVKSNAIVFCRGGMTLGIGAGQMSRVDAARLAIMKAQQAGLTLAGSAVASDAFFPFRDGLEVVIAAGASCVIQPGGSMRDDEVIAAADQHNIAMVLTGTRHFRH